MKKIFTAIATVIVTRFIMKAVSRIKHPEELRKEYEEAERYRNELKREVDRKHQEWERRQKRARPLDYVSPSYDAEMNAQAEARRWDGPKVAAEGCDMMALRPRMDMATASNFEPAIGSCAR